MAKQEKKFPSGFLEAGATEVDGNTPVFVGVGNTAKRLKLDEFKNYLTIEGQRIQAVGPGALPAGPTGQTRYMEVTSVGSWTYGGSTIGTNADGFKTTFFWTGSTWVNNGSVRVKGDAGPSGATLSQLFNASKVGGYAIDEKVRDANYVEYVSLANANTAALTDATKWKPVGAKDYIEVERFDKLPQQYLFEDEFVDNSKGWTIFQGTPVININGGVMQVTYNASVSEAVLIALPSIIPNGVTVPVSIRIRALGDLKRVNVGVTYGSATSSPNYTNITDLTSDFKVYNFNVTGLSNANNRIVIGALNSFNIGGVIEVDYVRVGEAPYGEFKLESTKALKKLFDDYNANPLHKWTKWTESQKNSGLFVKSFDYDAPHLIAGTGGIFRSYGFFPLENVESVLMSRLYNTSQGKSAFYDASFVKLSDIDSLPSPALTGDPIEIKKANFPANAKYVLVFYGVNQPSKDFVLKFAYNKQGVQIDKNLTEDKHLESQGYVVEYFDKTLLTEQGYYAINNGNFTANVNYRASKKLPLDNTIKGVISNFINSASIAVISFYDEIGSYVGGYGNSLSQPYNKLQVIDSNFANAAFYTITININYLANPIKLLKSEYDLSKNVKTLFDIQKGIKVFNPNVQTVAEYNTANPSATITPYALFNAVDYSKPSVRIPNTVVTNSGSYLATIELRHVMGDKGAMDLILARKTQTGEWSQSLVYQYSSGLGRSMNPSFVIDRTGAHGPAGRIYLFFFLLKNDDAYAINHTRANSDLVYITSDDDGLTWTSPTSIKSIWGTKNPLVGMQFSSPANGIQLSDGTLVMPSMVTAGSEGSYGWRAGVFYKKVGGSWEAGDYALRASQDNECWVVEKPNGKVLMGARSETGNGIRHAYEFDYTNASYKIDATDLTYKAYDNCQMSVIKIVYNGVTFYAQSFIDNPAGGRSLLTVFVSLDLKKWTRSIIINQPISGGYANLSYYNSKLIMIYETGGHAISASFIDLSNALPKLLSDAQNILGDVDELENRALYLSKGWIS